jgi:hypothetical protein
MGAAEQLKPTKKQRRRDALVTIFTAWANQLAAVLDEFDLAEPDKDAPGPQRRKPTRLPYRPDPNQPVDPALAKRVEADMRRRGL